MPPPNLWTCARWWRRSAGDDLEASRVYFNAVVDEAVDRNYAMLFGASPHLPHASSVLEPCEAAVTSLSALRTPLDEYSLGIFVLSAKAEARIAKGGAAQSAPDSAWPAARRRFAPSPSSSSSPHASVALCVASSAALSAGIVPAGRTRRHAFDDKTGRKNSGGGGGRHAASCSSSSGSGGGGDEEEDDDCANAAARMAVRRAVEDLCFWVARGLISRRICIRTEQTPRPWPLQLCRRASPWVPLTEATPPILVLLSFVFGGFKGGKKKLTVQTRHQRLDSFDFSDYDAVVSVEEESEADQSAANDQTNLGNLAGSGGVDDRDEGFVVSKTGGAAERWEKEWAAKEASEKEKKRSRKKKDKKQLLWTPRSPHLLGQKVEIRSNRMDPTR